MATTNWLRAWRESRGLTLQQVADGIGTDKTQISKLELSHRQLTLLWLERFAKFFEVAPGDLMKPPLTADGKVILRSLAGPAIELSPVPVMGAVQAGVWREALQWGDDEMYAVAVPVSPLYASYSVFALEVRGPSMNELYPNKSVVFCVEYAALRRPPRSGERVVVQRVAKTGLIEATLKEYVVDNKGSWLKPRSNDPAFQQAWLMREKPADVEEIRIHALVIGSYRPESQ